MYDNINHLRGSGGSISNRIQIPLDRNREGAKANRNGRNGACECARDGLQPLKASDDVPRVQMYHGRPLSARWC